MRYLSLFRGISPFDRYGVIMILSFHPIAETPRDYPTQGYLPPVVPKRGKVPQLEALPRAAHDRLLRAESHLPLQKSKVRSTPPMHIRQPTRGRGARNS